MARYYFFPVIFFQLIIVNVQNIEKEKDIIGYRLIICLTLRHRVRYTC